MSTRSVSKVVWPSFRSSPDEDPPQERKISMSDDLAVIAKTGTVPSIILLLPPIDYACCSIPLDPATQTPGSSR